MKTIYQKLVQHFGGQVPAAKALKVSQANISGYVSGRWNMSEVVAMRAELATNGKFKASDLCPSLKEFQIKTA
ncbi:helix-turn-helix domain-containing protein [Acinetobacter baumannii]|uniref:helix-turn-helix domain-containing protein n=1 Tax=Acinetobacter baumannii TaxID=470 RepID=UPI001F500630|nr:helix-turn-helix domain-containing protein [Acinetobacter baumannii]USX62831.1 helix-turn-helix domain-containing protein [Acinetobacter baumannii]WOQ34674.1 helix-turn-helix domain-containing protein [Acinetobacter baumannii]